MEKHHQNIYTTAIINYYTCSCLQMAVSISVVEGKWSAINRTRLQVREAMTNTKKALCLTTRSTGRRHRATHRVSLPLERGGGGGVDMTISDVYRIINTHTHIHSDKVSHIYSIGCTWDL